MYVGLFVSNQEAETEATVEQEGGGRKRERSEVELG